MQVILLEHVHNLGNVGDVVRVRDGYGRNFLLPQGKALRATNENKQVFESRRGEIEKKNAERRSEAQKVAAKLNETFVLVIRQASDDGRLYGSVVARDVAHAVNEAHSTTLDKGEVVIQKPIKEIGVYPLKVRLHPEVEITVRVNVARSEADAEEAKEAFLNPEAAAKKKAETEAEEVAGQETVEVAAEEEAPAAE